MNSSLNNKRTSSKTSNHKEKRHSFSCKGGEKCSSVDEIKLRQRKSLSSTNSKRKNGRAHVEKKKQAQTLSSMVEKMKATSEELKYRSDKSKDVNVVDKYSKFFKCTKCQKTYRPVLNKHKMLDVHPILGVLMCLDCRSYYGDGDFSMDSDGEDKYCRWCGEGGTLFSCSKCICGFCDICIRRHFGNAYLKEVQEDDDWVCFFCNTKPLWYLRFITSVAEKAAKSHNEGVERKEQNLMSNTVGRKKRSMKKDESSDETESGLMTSPEEHKKKYKKRRSDMFLSSSDESDEETMGNSRKRLKFSNENDGASPSGSVGSFDENKFQAVQKLENILKLTEYQMGLGLNWTQKKFKKLKRVSDYTSVEKIKKECQKIKWFISVISSYLVGFCNSIDTVEKGLGEETKTVDTSSPSTDHMTYSSIIQFLGFVTNQVKTFNEKGITLQNLLNAEVYEDSKVLGFKKISKDFNSSPSMFKEGCSSSPESMEEKETKDKSEDDENAVESTEGKAEENDFATNLELSSPEIDASEENKNGLSSVEEKSQEGPFEASEDLSPPQKDTSTEEKTPPEGNQNEDWGRSVNGEDVQDILTILESA